MPIAPPPPLQEGRVALRVLHRRHARELRQLLVQNRAWLEQWEATLPGGGSVAPGSTSLVPMIRALRAQMRAGVGVSFVITYDDCVVGQLSVSDISGGAIRSAQIGYWVSQHVAGRGIAPMAVALATDYLFGVLYLHRMELCIRTENAASLRIPQKLGMRYEGRRERYIHINGAWADHECFAITREEIPGGIRARLGAPRET